MAQRKGNTGPVSTLTSFEPILQTHPWPSPIQAAGTAFGYKGVFDGLRSVARTEGVLSLWKGLLPRLVLKSLGSSVWLSVYMATRSAFASLV